MIVFYLKEILSELNISQTYFAKLSNVRPNTINDMCNNKTKRIEVHTLSQIMSTLNKLSENEYKICDIIKFTKDKVKGHIK